MDLYAENILDHFKHPRNAGSLASPTVQNREENVSCGDDMTIDLLIDDGVIKDLKWQGQGCAISQAAMSLFSEELIGKKLDDAAAMKKDDVLSLLGVPIGARRLKCALLCLHTLKNALHVAIKEQTLSWLQNVEIDNEG